MPDCGKCEYKCLTEAEKGKCPYQPKPAEVMPLITEANLFEVCEWNIVDMGISDKDYILLTIPAIKAQRDADLEAHYKLAAEREAEFTEAIKKILAEWAEKEKWLAKEGVKTLRANLEKEVTAWLEQHMAFDLSGHAYMTISDYKAYIAQPRKESEEKDGK